jgi:hypothetical protein
MILNTGRSHGCVLCFCLCLLQSLFTPTPGLVSTPQCSPPICDKERRYVVTYLFSDG